MLARIFITLVLVSSSLYSYAQFDANVIAYYKNVNQGKIWFVKKDYSKAAESGIKGLSYMHPFREELDQVAYWCSLADRDKEAVKYFKQAVLAGLDYSDTAAYPDHYRARTGTKAYKDFVRSLDSLHNKFNSQLSLNLCLLIESMITRDQAFRNDNFLSNPDSAIKQFCRNQLVQTDTSNLSVLLDHFASRDIPTESNVTPELFSAFKILIHHMTYYTAYDHSKPKAEKLIALVTDAIHKGVLPNSFLYSGLDRSHQLCCKTQLYGTFYSRTADRKITYTDIDDIAHVDKRRDEWLLLPLYWSMRFNFDDNYKLPEGYTYNEQ